MKNNILITAAAAVTILTLVAGCDDRSQTAAQGTDTNGSPSGNAISAGLQSNGISTANSTSNGARILIDQTTNSVTSDVDNSKVNQRDRDTNNLTPLDQGNSDSDRMVSASIRKMVVSSTNNFSMTAKNIKIITKDGKVTLRGPVKSDDEKTGIESIAKGVAGEGNVDNQLEVKNNQ